MLLKKTVLFGVCMVVCACLAPLLLRPLVGQRASTGTDTVVETAQPETTAETPVPANMSRDADTHLQVRTQQGDVEMSMEEYLWQAVAGEMPAGFDDAALQAQAVALRSYVACGMVNRKENHPTCDVCTDPACCAAFATILQLEEAWGSHYTEYREKVRRACQATDGEVLCYLDEPALCMFHASSYLTTEDATAVGAHLPYLCSVDSPETPETVETLITEVDVATGDFIQSLQSLYPQADLSAPPDALLGQSRLTSSGRVDAWYIGDTWMSGQALRAVFSLRSNDFTLTYTGPDTGFHFTVRGYGHGLGMSQVGANLLAKQGWTYTEILSHYYPGTVLTGGVT